MAEAPTRLPLPIEKFYWVFALAASCAIRPTKLSISSYYFDVSRTHTPL
eukprot:gene11195-7769_t